jgi:hypothetical protein
MQARLRRRADPRLKHLKISPLCREQIAHSGRFLIVFLSQLQTHLVIGREA